MDHPTPNRPSGIPRLSKLPVLSKRSSQVFAQPSPSHSPSHEIPFNYRPTAQTPKLQKRASIASFPRGSFADQHDFHDASANASGAATRGGTVKGTRPTSRRPLSTRTSSYVGRPSSRGNEQRKPPPTLAKPNGKPEDEENHDQLGSLDGFRAASRQGFRDEDSSPLEYPEPSELNDEMFQPRDRTKSRPSLSDRTIESLQGLPSTPKDRRRSSFFSPVESPMDAMGPPPRPPSALSRNGSSGSSRPGTSDGIFAKLGRPSSPAKRTFSSAKPAARTTSFGFTPAKQPKASATLTSRLQASKENASSVSRASSPSKIAASGLSNDVPIPKAGSKTVAARPASKPKPLGDAFAPPQTPTSAAKPVSQGKRVSSNPTNASSAALREQIAAAKAAVRKEKAKHDSPQQVDQAQFDAFEPSSHIDPFNLAPKDGKHILRNRVKSAWTDGKLNIAGLELKRIPEEVVKMYDTQAMEDAKVNWAEVVDLTKFIGADNELEELSEDVFPDKSADELMAEEDGQGNPFGGLETLDLHGNALHTVPLGLRRLERLTRLDLAHNKLDNACLDIIAQISSLKELKLGHNNISGNLPSTLCQLTHLETLEIQSSRLLGLPEALRELVSLKVLNVSGNQLTALPMEALQHLRLQELDASSNALIGSLFPLGSVSAHLSLQTLNVANNSLAALTFSEALVLPQLRHLDVTNNHFTALPSVAEWQDLVTLMAGENKIAELPKGFASLARLKNVNFESNELRLLEPAIGRMERLETFVLAANPLQVKKYLTMNATDIKQDLLSRLEPMQDGDDGEVSDPETVISPSAGSSSKWTLQNGVLDLANRKLDDSINDTLGSFLRSNEVRELRLQGNKLTTVPPALWLAQDLRNLDLSNNPLAADWVSDELELPALLELKLSHCRLTSLEPLIFQLSAPDLKSLNISGNRLSSTVPHLRTTLPNLTTFFAKDNRFNSVTADALQGLETVNLASNDLQALPAEIGLLWDQGLRHLDVSSNAFRVPNYRILDKGTEATLRWLRDRLPAGEGAEGREDE